MKKILIISTMVISMMTSYGQTIDLTSGGSGTTSGFPQSFNETRGVDVTVLSSSLYISSVTLNRFCTGTSNDSGFVGVRIYNSTTQALLFTQNRKVNPMYDGSVSISTSFVLNHGQSYRISLYCYGYGNNHNSGSAFAYLPTFPYNDSHNILQINQAYESAYDSFPNNTNLEVPFIDLTYGILGIDDIENTSITNIFPNPSSAQTTLRVNKILKDATLSISNSLGQQVKQIDNINGETVTLSRDNLPSGVYYIRLKDQSKIYTGKLIIADN